MELMKKKAEDLTNISAKILMKRALRIHFLSGGCIYGKFAKSFQRNEQKNDLQQYNFNIPKEDF